MQNQDRTSEKVLWSQPVDSFISNQPIERDIRTLRIERDCWMTILESDILYELCFCLHFGSNDFSRTLRSSLASVDPNRNKCNFSEK